MPLDPDLQHRFAFHAATTEEKRMAHGSVRLILHDAAQAIHASLPKGREAALFLTHMEEAMFWANAAIARNSIGDA